MITVIENESYNVSYYKTDLNKELFEKYVNEYLSGDEKFECKKTIHSSGLFFERRKKAPIRLLNNTIEIIFSQRKEYSLISISYYIPVINKYFRFIFAILLFALLITIQSLDVGYPNLKLFNLMFNLIVSAILLFKGLISSFLYTLATRDIATFLRKVIISGNKIKSRDYQQLLSDDLL